MKKDDYRIVLCGANAYEQKYYFNESFAGLPESIKEELRILCVLFTEEVGGVFTVGFTPEGKVALDTEKDTDDLLYDEIGSALLLKRIRATKKELLRSLSVYYRVTFLKEDAATLLAEDEDGEEDDEA